MKRLTLFAEIYDAELAERALVTGYNRHFILTKLNAEMMKIFA